MDPVEARTKALKLSPKLYHESELEAGHQQSIAEAPASIRLDGENDVATSVRLVGRSTNEMAEAPFKLHSASP